jgi:hypothetical protein
LRELKEFVRVEERLQFTRSDEARDDRTGVGAACAAKRLEREREIATRGYTTATIYPSCVFYFPLTKCSSYDYAVGVCISSFPDEQEE